MRREAILNEDTNKLSLIGVHLRPSAANIGFASRIEPQEKHIWPPMNAD